MAKHRQQVQVLVVAHKARHTLGAQSLQQLLPSQAQAGGVSIFQFGYEPEARPDVKLIGQRVDRLKA
jgi:hypothetical protein